MMLLTSNLFHCPVVSPGSGKLANLGNPIIDPANGRLIAFFIQAKGPFSKPHIISVSDILLLDKKIIIINDPESIVPPQEVVRVKQIIDQKINFPKNRAYTESGSYLGRVNDILINTEPIEISRYYIHHMLGNRIIPSDKVVRITRKGIFFTDDVANVDIATQTAPV